MSDFDPMDIADDFAPFWKEYYKEDLLAFIEGYPEEHTFTIAWSDLWQFHQPSAETYIEHSEPVTNYLIDDLDRVSFPLEVNWDHLDLAVELPADKTEKVGDLRKDHGEQYIAVEGRLQKLSKPQEQLENIAFVCEQCNGIEYIPQTRHDIQEPHECNGCERKGPFNVDFDLSESIDRVEAKLKEPPHESKQTGRDVHCFIEDELIEVGGSGGLFDHAGERVVFHGVYNGELDIGKQNADPIIDRYLDVKAISFPESNLHEDDIREHKETFKELASRDDAHELVEQSIAPTISGGKRTRQLKTAAWMFLFAAPEWERDGDRVRGDNHQMWIGDPGTGKSTIGNDVVTLSPKCEDVSATNSTGVGLTASAQQDDFAGGEWTLQPGALPMASGGHVRVDELDKLSSADQQKLHEALEKQKIHVRKANIKAELETKAGLLAMGNPSGGRWDNHSNELAQIDMDGALVSRFDLILKVVDTEDREMDAQKASHALDAMHEVQDNTKDKDAIDRPVDAEILRAWVAYARENINPVLTEETKAQLQEFYVEQRAQGSDEQTSITMRMLEAGVRLSSASARLALRDEIKPEDVDRATDMIMRMMGDIYLDEQGNLDVSKVDESQGARIDRVERYIKTNQPVHEDEVADEVRGTDRKIKKDIQKLKRKGELYEPDSDGVLRHA